ncbi:MAG: superoxide dismutase family protein [Deinococcota bacterium]|nr:superoxide dismutase family protein [Deinococcota bacterium]
MKRMLKVGLVAVMALGLSAFAQEVTLQVAEDETLGDYLTDAAGMTLYLFLNDSENTSNCYDQCAENWPPLLSEGEPEAAEGVDASLIGTAERTDGSTQVTYNGWPLYYFARDENPGDISGQDVGEVWYVVSPEGERVGEEGETADAADTQDTATEDTATEDTASEPEDADTGGAGEEATQTGTEGDEAEATAQLMDAEGNPVGTATLTTLEDGSVHIRVELSGLEAASGGEHGIHIHEVGECTPPDFETAGEHFNPTGAEHGLENPEGPHAGDLPNIEISSDGSASYEVTTDLITLGEGDTSIFDGDGTSLVIHAERDDQVTDPTGGSGERIACGVIMPMGN